MGNNASDRGVVKAAHVAAIEIGGTKLQIAIARAGHPEHLEAVWRTQIQREEGAAGILARIEEGFRELANSYDWGAIGIGFGGPISTRTGRATTSHQVRGWDDFDLAGWCRERWPVPLAVDNDCNVCALAEAVLGAGRGGQRVFYATVGTGIGGGFVVKGTIDGGDRPAVAEIGHLRPGLDATDPARTVESLASGLGMEQTLSRRIAAIPERERPEAVTQLLALCDNDVRQLNARLIAEAARNGNAWALETLEQAARVLGWALAQTTTLLAPDRIVLGGGVTSIGPSFLDPVTRWWQTYLFPPLAGSCQLVTSSLGDTVVLHGALLLVEQQAFVESSATDR